MPGVSIPAIALPYPTLQTTASSAGKTLVVYGASSSISSKTIQITVAPGINVIAIAWPTTTTWLSAAELLRSLTTRTPWSSRASPTPSWRANSNSSAYSTPSPLRRRTLCEARRWPPRLRAPSSRRQCALERQDRYDLRRHRRCDARLPGFPDTRAAERKAKVSSAANHCRQGLRAYQRCAEEVKGRCECDEAGGGIVGR